MSKKRLSADKNESGDWLSKTLKRHSFIGIALSGGKSDKTCLADLEYYPEQKKIFLRQLTDKIKNDGHVSADLAICEMISNCNPKPEFLAYNVALSQPKCLRCKLKCPGYEICKEPEIQWMWTAQKKLEQKSKNAKLFTPYTERSVELFLRTELDESFHVQHAMGANMAPLMARAHFLNRRLKLKCIEVFPRISVWRVGKSLHIQNSYLRHHKHSVDGQEARMAILKELVRRDVIFIYEQDVRLMVESSNAFDAFICGLTAVLKFRNQCETRPKGFPRSESWIEIPKDHILW